MKNNFKPNVFTAFGVLFLISSAIMPIQDLIVWGPELVYYFYFSPEITAEKLSIGVSFLGVFLIIISYKKRSWFENKNYH